LENTYHLYYGKPRIGYLLRAKPAGLHNLNGWEKPILRIVGDTQVFFTGRNSEEKEEWGDV